VPIAIINGRYLRVGITDSLGQLDTSRLQRNDAKHSKLMRKLLWRCLLVQRSGNRGVVPEWLLQSCCGGPNAVKIVPDCASFRKVVTVVDAVIRDNAVAEVAVLVSCGLWVASCGL